jgi:dienelactone hydrolase
MDSFISTRSFWLGLVLASCFTSLACSDETQFGKRNDRRVAPSDEPIGMEETDRGDDAIVARPDTQVDQADEDSKSDAPVVPPPARLYDPGKRGPYTFQSYSDANHNDVGYQSAVIYYPSNAPGGAWPATTLSGGFTNTKEQMTWLAQHLASHGFVVIVFTPTNNLVLDPNIWATGHKASLAKLRAEHQRPASPLAGKIKLDRLGIMGFSMGGAGTIVALNELGDRGVQAAVPICAFQPQIPTAKVPTLLLTGTADTVARPAPILNAYQQMSTGAPKAFAEFNGMTHLDVPNGGAPLQHENLARFGTAWYLVYLGQQSAYQTYLQGDELAKQKASTMVFADAETDFLFQEN